MEKRQQRRASVQCAVSFTDEEGSLAEGVVYNLSITGCAVRCATNVTEGASLSLLITLPGDQVPVVIESVRVRWSATEEFGVQFMTMQKEEEKRLERFLAGQSKGKKAG